MELGYDIITLVLLIAAGLTAGFIDAIAGGGGMLTIPALMYAGLPAHAVLATNKLAATFGSGTAALTYYRKRFFTPSHWYPALACTALGAIAGTSFVGHVESVWLEWAIPLIVAAAALYTLFNPIKTHSQSNCLGV